MYVYDYTKRVQCSVIIMQSTQNSLKTVLTINEQILDKYTVTLVILSSDCTRQKEMEKSVLDSIKCALVVNIKL